MKPWNEEMSGSGSHPGPQKLPGKRWWCSWPRAVLGDWEDGHFPWIFTGLCKCINLVSLFLMGYFIIWEKIQFYHQIVNFSSFYFCNLNSSPHQYTYLH